MGTPFRISEELVAEAKAIGEAMDRSATGQLEHWARLGRAVEAVLGFADILELQRSGEAVSLDEALARARSPRARAKALKHLEASKRPRYGADPARPGGLIRIEPDGKRTPGRFVGRTFVPDSETKR